MFGVYLLYSMRKLKNPFVAESFVFTLLAVVLLYLVSMPSVWANMLDSENFLLYFIMAFFNTELLIQSALILTGVTILFFVRNLTFHAILKTRLT